MRGIYGVAFALATTTAMLVLVRVLNGAMRFHRGSKKDAARAIVEASQTIAVLIVCGAVLGGVLDGEPKADAMWVGVSSAISALLLVVLGRASIATLAGGGALREVAAGNVAAAVAAGAHQIAVGILLSHCVYGRGWASLGVAIAFFAIGLVTLHVLVLVFRMLTAYDDAQEILGQNLAAALSYAGAVVALAIIIGNAANGDFDGWATSLRQYGIALSFTVLLYPVRQLVVQSLLLGEPLALHAGVLDARVGRERDNAAAVVEAGTYIATALMVSQL
jgi:uncharacterized membrane protein YjfL (UPF0719 family)